MTSIELSDPITDLQKLLDISHLSFYNTQPFDIHIISLFHQMHSVNRMDIFQHQILQHRDGKQSILDRLEN